VHAIESSSNIPPHSPSHVPPSTCSPPSELQSVIDDSDEWTPILTHASLGPHREHFFHPENVVGRVFTHVRLTIYPDGGVKRVRIFGSKQSTQTATITPTSSIAPIDQLTKSAVVCSFPPSRFVPALPLSPEAFSPFGQVIQSYPDVTAVPSPRTTKITPANFGTALKYHKLTLLASNYAENAGATSGISVYRCEPTPNATKIDIKALERHPYTNQAFIPLGTSAQKRYIVAVAHNGKDDKPDTDSLRAFIVRGDQGIVYNTAVWRKHPNSVRLHYSDT
jgi:allantoicase